MKPKWIREVRDLAKSQEFASWYRQYNDLRQSITNARDRRDDLLAQVNMVRFRAELTQQQADDTLFAAGECEDLSARAHAEFAEIENNSFELLSAFEMQRQRTTDAWNQLGRQEQLLEDERQHASELRASSEAARKEGSAEARAEAERLETRLKESELQIEGYAADTQEALANQTAAETEKDDLWVEVEATWSNAFRANMARTEHSYQGRRVRSLAEGLFARAVSERRRVGQLEEDAQRMTHKIAEIETEFEALLEEAREGFQCCVVKEFLYWPHKDDVRAALCMPLIDESVHFNMQVKALQIYSVERARGLEFIEPIIEEDLLDAQDSRLDAFFSPRQEAH